MSTSMEKIYTESVYSLDDLEEGKRYLFSVLFIDRVKSTEDHRYYDESEVQRRARAFHEIVEENIRSSNARCGTWVGDSTTAFFYVARPESTQARAAALAETALSAARAIREGLAREEELKAYIALHLGFLNFRTELGKVKSLELDVAGRMLKVCPPDSVLASKELWLLLSRDRQRGFRYLGQTSRDGVEVFVYPAQRQISNDKRSDFVPEKNDRYASRAAYTDFIRASYGMLSPRGLRQEKLVSLPLFDIFQPLKLRAKQSKSFQEVTTEAEEHFEGRLDVRDSQGTGGGRSAPVEVTDILREARPTVILGSPGSGKSTLVKWLALSCTEGKFSIQERLGLEESLLPIPVSVGHLSKIWKASRKKLGVNEAIVRYFEEHSIDVSYFLAEAMEKGDCLILFDGLDEVPEDVDRREISRWIEAFVRARGNRCVIITCREAAFRETGGPWETYTIDGLTVPQAKLIAERWLVALEKNDRGDTPLAERVGKEESQKLMDTLVDFPRLSTFVSNPLLLTLTCLVHKLEARLPNHRVELFERMIQTLVETWHQARTLGIRSAEEQKMDFRTEAVPVLAPMALLMHENFPSGTVPKDQLRDFIIQLLTRKGSRKKEAADSVETFINKLTEGSGLLVEKAPGLWGFDHLSFEEYLAAKELVRSNLYISYLDKCRYDPRWEEIWILVAGELGIIRSDEINVTSLLKDIFDGTGHEIQENLLRRHILLAGKCLANSANVYLEVEEAIIAQVIACWGSDISGLRERATNVLREMLHMAQACALIREQISARLNDDNSEVRREAVRTIGELGLKEAWVSDALRKTLKDKEADVRSAALDVVRELGLKENWAADGINEALNDTSRDVRRVAIRAIRELWLKDAWAVEGLRKALTEKHADVRGAALVAIINVASGEDWAVEAIKETLRDENPDVRRATIHGIGAVGSREDWAIEAVKEALKDENPRLRRAAIHASTERRLKEGWVIEAVKQALSDENPRTRRAAIYAITQFRLKEDWAIEAIKEALKDKSPRMRWAATHAIAGLALREDWAIRAIQKALEDSEPSIRRGTMNAISSLGVRADWVIKALKEGLKDGDPDVRRAVIRTIAALELVEDWAIQGIQIALKDKKADVRRTAINTIGDLALNEDWVQRELIQAMKDTSTVRAAAFEALWKLY